MCLALVGFTTTIAPDHPRLVGALAAVVLFLTWYRVPSLSALPAPGHQNRVTAGGSRSWWYQMVAVLILAGALWGLTVTWACLVYGYHDPNTILLVVYQAAIAVLGSGSFAYNLRLARLYLALLFLPPFLAHGFFPDGRHWGPLCTFGSYAIYLSVRAGKLHAAYLRQREETRDLRAVAGTDPPTGLPNRLQMLRNLAHEVETARRPGPASEQRLAVLFIDLDGFKAINDRYSHRTGDLFLCEIARRFSFCAGSPESVSRLRGDEFTVLPADPALSEQQVLEIAQDVLQAARHAAVIAGQTLSVTASIGISFFPEDADTESDLLRAADHAMYEAKRAGANHLLRRSTENG